MLQPTEEQRPVIHEKTGLFTVKACPGSGKTFTVAARLQRVLENWPHRNQGIAALSFTNVAHAEIAGYLRTEFHRATIGYPHFLGTIDSFTNQYVFLPFGHYAMRTQARPRLCGAPHNDIEPIGNWMYWGEHECQRHQCKLNDFTYDIRGHVIRLGHAAMGHNCPVTRRPCVTQKQAFNRQGYATQNDANYFALEVLRKYPAVAAALVRRFPVMMIDEAQDTSSIQMAMANLLITAGLQELMLVGDPDQAIYEWRNAEPAVFLEKCNAYHENSTTFGENWRSSQRICNCATQLARHSQAMRAVNPMVSDCPIPPEVIGYDGAATIRQHVAGFVQRCNALGLTESMIHVLVRSKSLLNVIAPGTIAPDIDPWDPGFHLTPALAQAKYLHENGKLTEALRLLERALHRMRYPNSPFAINRLYDTPAGLTERAGLVELLEVLPQTKDLLLGTWVVETGAALSRMDNPFHGAALRIKRRSQKCDYPRLSFAELFAAPRPTQDGFSLQTVHGAKGQSLDAVLVVLKSKAGNSRRYINLFDLPAAEHEELRIVYVAITRAKRILTLLVPTPDAQTWRGHLLSERHD